jgi:serine/threonine-protein kinase RsbW
MDEQTCCIPGLVLCFHTTIDSFMSEVGDASDRVMRFVKTLPCAQADLGNLHLTLFEALSNAIIHGNREDPRKSVSVCAGCDGLGQVLIAITDQGDGFDPAALADPTSADNLSSTHGRGVFLMRLLVDKVEFNLGGRQVVLRYRAVTHSRTMEPTDGAVLSLD